MGKIKRGIIALTSTVMALSAAVPVFAEGEDPADAEPVTKVTEEGSTDESTTVSIPATAIERLLIAPSISPISIALEVPMA